MAFTLCDRTVTLSILRNEIIKITNYYEHTQRQEKINIKPINIPYCNKENLHDKDPKKVLEFNKRITRKDYC